MQEIADTAQFALRLAGSFAAAVMYSFAYGLLIVEIVRADDVLFHFTFLLVLILS